MSVAVQTKDIINVVIHGRGGQGAITASNLLCECAFRAGFKDVLDIPKIGAERRGAPIQGFVRLSRDKEIKLYSGVRNADYTLIFDYTLLDIPSVVKSLSGIILLNAPEFMNLDCIDPSFEVWIVDATGISVKNKLMISGFPILNTLILGAFAKMTGIYSLDIIKDVYKARFGKNWEKNFLSAKEAYESVKKVGRKI
ncbi:MAG: 2-oxoacid:acceptor oxidoreductase family protein [Candidatus Lokiarchaeota archaeon]|nr:2-oxoacid:acceptor oxidoreductase family protein [Candidatus Lokiarchaeota archaeon]